MEIDEAPQLLPHIEHEAHELGIDARVAIQRDGSVVAGDRELRVERAHDGCTVAPPALPSEVVCVRALLVDPHADVVVAVPVARLHAHRSALAITGAVVLALVLVGSIGAGVVMSRRFMRPLHRLRDAVGSIDPSALSTAPLPPPVDLAELDALRGTIAGLVDRLHVELQRERRFAANAAHELRTPLAKIRAEIELACEGPSPDERSAAMLARLDRTTSQLVPLIERLLVLATPREALATSHGTSLAQLAHALGEHRDADEAARLHVTTEGDTLVRGDEVLLGAMLDNLVDNALKFTTGAVRVGVHEVGPDVILDVEDDGPGIPAALADHAFAPFRRGDDTRDRPGHGLGLALVAHIARAYGGTAAFVSPRRRGTHVRVTLPAHHGTTT